MATERLRRTVIENPYIPKRGGRFPSAPQGYFLTLPVDEAMYGGAAGGGKSDALLAGALQDVHVPGYAALLLRRTFADLKLPGALIDRAHEWLQGTDARWNDNDHQWLFPKTGATLTFGYLENERDKYRYQSSQFQYIGFDELTQFTLPQYLYMPSRLRRLSGMNVPLRIRSATNPGGVGHDWVKQRFIDSGDPSRVFVPALLSDNPGLDRSSYERQLDLLDPVTRAQLKAGDWDVRPEGNLFRREWFDDHYIDAPPKFSRVVRCWDLAGTKPNDQNPDPDYTAGVKLGQTPDGLFVVLDARETRDTPAEVEKYIRRAADEDGRSVEVYIEQEPGASGKSLVSHYQRAVLAGFSVYGVRSSGAKLTRAKPFSAACENGLVRLMRGRTWVGLLLDRLTSFGMKGQHDDMGDAAAGAHRALTGEPEDWTEEDFQQAIEGGGESLDDDAPARTTPMERLMARARARDGADSEIL